MSKLTIFFSVFVTVFAQNNSTDANFTSAFDFTTLIPDNFTGNTILPGKIFCILLMALLPTQNYIFD